MHAEYPWEFERPIRVSCDEISYQQTTWTDQYGPSYPFNTSVSRTSKAPRLMSLSQAHGNPDYARISASERELRGTAALRGSCLLGNAGILAE